MLLAGRVRGRLAPTNLHRLYAVRHRTAAESRPVVLGAKGDLVSPFFDTVRVIAVLGSALDSGFRNRGARSADQLRERQPQPQAGGFGSR